MELMVAYQRGELRAFEDLYARLCNDARRYFARACGDRRAVHDLVQEMFLEMHRSRRTYSPPLPVRPWIFGIARNVLARSRRATTHHGVQSTLEMTAESELASPTGSTDCAESLDLEKAIASLPASTRDPWLLHHVFGFSFDAIADRLGITVVAAKLRSSRATRALRTALKHPTGGNDD